MPILPVLDLMQGQIVRGIGGRRDKYRPIVSKLTESAEPLAVADALRERFGFTEFYLADLDAIQHGRLSKHECLRLRDANFRFWIDAGLRSAHDAALGELIELDVQVIVGLESVRSPNDVQNIVQRVGADHTVFSLDLNGGRPLGDADAWPSSDPWGIADHTIANLGIRRLLVLDLAHVGVGDGVGTEGLCARLKSRYPEVQLTTGGGVRHINDVKRLLAIGVDYVLVASALHDGRITPDDVKRL